MTGIERPTTKGGTEVDHFDGRSSRRAQSSTAGLASTVKTKARRRDRHNRKLFNRLYRTGRADW